MRYLIYVFQVSSGRDTPRGVDSQLYPTSSPHGPVRPSIPPPPPLTTRGRTHFMEPVFRGRAAQLHSPARTGGRNGTGYSRSSSRERKTSRSPSSRVDGKESGDALNRNGGKNLGNGQRRQSLSPNNGQRRQSPGLTNGQRGRGLSPNNGGRRHSPGSAHIHGGRDDDENMEKMFERAREDVDSQTGQGLSSVESFVIIYRNTL